MKEAVSTVGQPIDLTETELDLVSGGSSQTHINNVRDSNIDNFNFNANGSFENSFNNSFNGV
jgi:hypothetical protein